MSGHAQRSKWLVRAHACMGGGGREGADRLGWCGSAAAVADQACVLKPLTLPACLLQRQWMGCCHGWCACPGTGAIAGRSVGNQVGRVALKECMWQ